jgi:uncharacterized protein YndB with AHSA1/START domain
MSHWPLTSGRLTSSGEVLDEASATTVHRLPEDAGVQTAQLPRNLRVDHGFHVQSTGRTSIASYRPFWQDARSRSSPSMWKGRPARRRADAPEEVAPMTRGVTLVTKRTIRASAKCLFDAWTRPEQLVAWWGPRPVTCRAAEIDLRVGGRYRIVNALPDGATRAIEGTFEIIEPERKLVYTWRAGEDQASRVTVLFESTPGAMSTESRPTPT